MPLTMLSPEPQPADANQGTIRREVRGAARTVQWLRARFANSLHADRTSELRKKGYQGRRLGPVQMTTDTAVRVTRICVQDKGASSMPGCDRAWLRDAHKTQCPSTRLPTLTTPT